MLNMERKMRAFILPTPDEMGKFFGVVSAFPSIWQGKILDVGARSGRLKRAIEAINPKFGLYCGLDLFPPATIIGNLERGLPFDRESFDVVVALDVLEHTDNIYFAFSELCRISKRFVVVTLPNMYEIKARLKFLFGRPPSGKYGLPITPPKDRHRWLFSFEEARKFAHYQGKKYQCKVASEGPLIGPRRKFMKLLIRRYPNLLAPSYLVLLERIVE